MMKALAKRPADRYQSMPELHAALEHCYGSVRFRRSLEVLPPGTAVEALRRPIPLTQLKRRAESDSDPGVVPSDPVPGAMMDPGSSQPLLLTRRKSGKHKTLPFGMPMADAIGDPIKPPKK